MIDLAALAGAPVAAAAAGFTIRPADRSTLEMYRALRREVFVAEQGLFDHDDHDEADDDPRAVVLVAVDAEQTVLGGVRVAPKDTGPDLGWWTGSRLVVRRDARRRGGIGPALVRAACALAETTGVLRFEATVQRPNVSLFRRLGWESCGATTVAGVDHELMRWPIDRFGHQARQTKAALGGLLAGLAAVSGGLGGRGFVGDDGAPVPGSDLVAACDAIVPSMVERDPEWAGWCSVLVNVNDLTAMGARPVGLLDAIGARDASFAARVLSGLRRATQAWGVPVLGGHTQLGVPAALAVTGLGRAERPVPGGGGSVGDAVSLTADLSGGWRRGYRGAQWDSTTGRSAAELRILAGSVAKAAPRAAKDVSMAGLVGTLGMLAESAGTGAVIEVGRVPRPEEAVMADWLGCFPGFAMLTVDRPGMTRMQTPFTTTAEIGTLVPEPGVRLRWPDGVETDAIAGPVSGLGVA